MQLLESLFENVDLPAEFKEKTATLFEAAVDEKVKSQLQSIQESFDAKVDGAKATFLTEATAAIDSVVEATVLEWAKENSVPLDAAAKSSLAESFLADLRGMFEKADIEMSGDAAGQALTELTEQNTKLVNESQDFKAKYEAAQATLTALHMKNIMSEMTSELAETTAGRVTKLCESFDFKSEADFRSKVAMVLEAVAGIKGTFSADGTTVAVIGDGGKQAQADTAAGVHAPEGGELVTKPAGAKVASAEGDKGTPDSSQATLKEALENKIAAVAPFHGKDLIAETLKQFK